MLIWKNLQALHVPSLLPTKPPSCEEQDRGEGLLRGPPRARSRLHHTQACGLPHTSAGSWRHVLAEHRALRPSALRAEPAALTLPSSPAVTTSASPRSAPGTTAGSPRLAAAKGPSRATPCRSPVYNPPSFPSLQIPGLISRVVEDKGRPWSCLGIGGESGEAQTETKAMVFPPALLCSILKNLHFSYQVLWREGLRFCPPRR